MKLSFALPSFAMATLALTACVPNSAESTGAIEVSSTDTACVLSATSTPSGHVVFAVTNDGSDVTEFYVLGGDGLQVVSELENIGPGTTRELVVTMAPGDYLTACKPGMTGDGIRAPFTVTDSGTPVSASGDRDEQLEAAADQYLAYVREEVEGLEAKTQAFVDAYTSGDDDLARELYTAARVHWERIEPVAESFGDLDPAMDAREADLGEGEKWTGWHHAEKDLWPPAEGYALEADERAALAAQLLSDTQDLSARVNADDFAVDAFQVGNGAKELLDEVAAGKITGEEEIWSHTDLWDFQANVDGALMAFQVLRPIIEDTNPELAEELDERFDALNALLAQYGSIEDGFVYYDELSPEQVLELARAVDALAEPLSQLTAAAVL